MKIKVVATEKYKELGLLDAELNVIPNAGDTFEVSEERFNVLAGDNKYNVAFVTKAEDKPKKKSKNED